MSASEETLQGGTLLVDDFLPRYDVPQVQHVLVAASPASTYLQVRQVDFMQSQLVRTLVWCQGFPEQLVRRALGLPTRVVAPAHALLDDMLATQAWLDELPVPSQIGATRVGGVDLNRSRIRAALAAVLALALAPGGFTVAAFTAQVHAATGQTDTD